MGKNQGGGYQMGLFAHKTEVTIDGFCRQFYDSVVFHAVVAGLDFNELWWKTVFSSVVEADKSFAVIDKPLFLREMTALRLELFALAWGHKFKHEKFTVPQSVFTRQYLDEHGKREVWDIMLAYNHVIAQSVTATATGEQMEGRIGRARRTGINLARTDMYSKQFTVICGGIEPSAITEEQNRWLDAIARVANRIGADIRRSDCVATNLLAARLADRLNCDANLSSEALFRLSAVIFGLYEGATEALKDISL
jgi:hypothetical protein